VTSSVRLQGVSVRVRSHDIVDSVDLEVVAGELLTILGASGSGKTTLLRVIAGLTTPSAGSVHISGSLASEAGRIVVPPEERGVAMVFQDLALWPHLTVHGNLAFGLDAHHVPRGERDARIEAMLRRVGLAEKAGRHPGELSGGERQRVAIARALVRHPGVVLLDEPLANLDLGLKREVLGLFRELLVEAETTAVHVTHEPNDAAVLGGRVAVVERGRLVFSGVLDELRERGDLTFVREILREA
jgi:ABC-type sugar transport system ATPase subunit